MVFVLPNVLTGHRAVMLCCFSLVFLSFFVLTPDGSTSIVVFILVALATFLVRRVCDMQAKSISYLLLGMLSYWAFGSDFVAAGPLAEFPLPVLLALSSLLALVSLVSYSDGKLPGFVFASSSLILLFFANKDLWSILSALSVFLSAYLSALFISSIRGKEGFLKKAVFASISSGFFLFLAGLSSVSSGVALAIYPSHSFASIALSALYLILATGAFTILALFAFDTVLSNIKMKRLVGDGLVNYGPEQPTQLSYEKTTQQKKGKKK